MIPKAVRKVAICVPIAVVQAVNDEDPHAPEEGGVPFAQHVFQPSVKVAAITTSTPQAFPPRPVVVMGDDAATVARLSQLTGTSHYSTGHAVHSMISTIYSTGGNG